MTRIIHTPPPGEIPEGRADAPSIGFLAYPRKRIQGASLKRALPRRPYY